MHVNKKNTNKTQNKHQRQMPICTAMSTNKNTTTTTFIRTNLESRRQHWNSIEKPIPRSMSRLEWIKLETLCAATNQSQQHLNFTWKHLNHVVKNHRHTNTTWQLRDFHTNPWVTFSSTLQKSASQICTLHVNIKREPKHETETLSMSDVNLHGDVHKPKYNDNYVP